MKIILAISLILFTSNAFALTETAVEGGELFSRVCTICHNNGEVPANAPDMHDIKSRYLKVAPSKEVFVEKVIFWLSQPATSKSEFPEAIDHFGLMPKFRLTTSKMFKVATYIYENDFKKP